jgi:Putative transposase
MSLEIARVFRGKVVAGLRDALHAATLTLPSDLPRLITEPVFAAWLRTLFGHDWVVYAKPPFGGPSHVLHYLDAVHYPDEARTAFKTSAITQSLVCKCWPMISAPAS